MGLHALDLAAESAAERGTVVKAAVVVVSCYLYK
jgi:hypothetical protein